MGSCMYASSQLPSPPPAPAPSCLRSCPRTRAPRHPAQPSPSPTLSPFSGLSLVLRTPSPARTSPPPKHTHTPLVHAPLTSGSRQPARPGWARRSCSWPLPCRLARPGLRVGQERGPGAEALPRPTDAGSRPSASPPLASPAVCGCTHKGLWQAERTPGKAMSAQRHPLAVFGKQGGACRVRATPRPAPRPHLNQSRGRRTLGGCRGGGARGHGTMTAEVGCRRRHPACEGVERGILDVSGFLRLARTEGGLHQAKG